MEIAILTIYVFICAILLVYSTVEFSLLINYLFRKPRHTKKQWEEWPVVTIQLPLYNEAYVVERLIDKVAAIRYPEGKLEIQVLDDSTDDTQEKARQKVALYRDQGIDIQYIARDNREGFKAGALDYGLHTARGEFIAVFDADFLPDENFLMEAMPYFSEEKVGVVQSRWTYINEDFSFLTRVQTIMLNTHFSVEHAGRNRSGAYINFNGTGGIWRRKCIEDAGGWMADTLTEDLDLSFRAQMKGWKFVYAMEIESPSELPVTFPGYKTQQFRWAKGAAECTRKNMRALWGSKKTPFWAKWVGSFHLLNSSVFLIVLGFILLSFPVTYCLQQISAETGIHAMLKLFVISNILLLLVFIGGNIGPSKNKLKTILLFPFTFVGFLILNMGISLYMSLGVLEGYLGRKSEFVRTPKFNVVGKRKDKVEKYTRVKITPLFMAECLILLYSIFQWIYAFRVGDIFALTFATMFFLGYGYNVAATLYYSTRSE